MSQVLVKPYWKRFAIALCASCVLVFACSISMQLHVLREPEWVLSLVAGVLIASVPGSALSALAFRQSQLALIIGAQLLTVVALAAWFGLRA